MDNYKENREKSNLPVISYSKLGTYKTCPRQYKFGYIDKLPKLDKPFLSFGSASHASLEKFHKEILAGCKDPIDQIMRRSFLEMKKEWEPKLTSEQIMEIFKIMQQYLDTLDPDKLPNVTHVEKKIWTTLDDSIIFCGFIDKVQTDDDGIIHVVDYKTTKDPKYLKDRTQLLLYAYTLHLENPEITKFRTSFTLLKHEMKSLVAEHEIPELLKAKDKLIADWNVVEMDKLLRATPMAWKCKYCDFIEYCKEGKALIHGVATKPAYGKVNW